MFLRLEQPLARAAAAVIARRKWGIMNAERVVFDEPPIVRIALPDQKPFHPLEQRGLGYDRLFERLLERRFQLEIGEHGLGDGDFGVEPTAKTVTRRIDPDCGLRALQRPVLAVLQLLEIGPHAVGAPGGIAGQVRNVVPIVVVRIDNDHGVVCGAAAKATGARIPDAVDGLAIVVRHVFVILVLPGVVGVMADEKVPAHRVVFRRTGMEDGDVVIVRKPIDVGIDGVAALELKRVPAGFHHKDLSAVLGKPRGDSAAAGARANNDIFEAFISHKQSPLFKRARSAVKWSLHGSGARPAARYGSVGRACQNVFRNAISASLSASPRPGSSSKYSVPK